MKLISGAAALFVITSMTLFVSGCETLSPQGSRVAAQNAAIRLEQPGNYFIARRVYKRDFKMWGWIREPGKPWNTAKLVMLNEQHKLAPDRAQNAIGSDNNYEYRFEGHFSGSQVYEPASDGFYPEFVLTSYELRSISPPMIYGDRRCLDPKIRLLAAPL